MRPKKDNNYININNNDFDNDSVLNIDLKSINFDNAALELALNVLQLKHNEYYEMTQSDVIIYYNKKIKFNNNINFILALKIILKYKFKDSNVVINKLNIIDTDDNITNYKVNTSKKKISLENKINLIKDNSLFENNTDYKIIQSNVKNNNEIKNNLINDKLFKNNNEFERNLNNKNSKVSQNNTIPLNSVYNDITSVNLKQINTNHNISNKQINIPINSNINRNNNRNNNIQEKNNNYYISNSSEFDIDSIINSFTNKKNNMVNNFYQ
jgi:hypothetical protein